VDGDGDLVMEDGGLGNFREFQESMNCGRIVDD